MSSEMVHARPTDLFQQVSSLDRLPGDEEPLPWQTYYDRACIRASAVRLMDEQSAHEKRLVDALRDANARAGRIRRIAFEYWFVLIVIAESRIGEEVIATSAMQMAREVLQREVFGRPPRVEDDS